MFLLRSFALRRFVQLIPTLLVIASITFFMGMFTPGDAATTRLGERATAAQVAEFKRVHGLDKPPLQQYFRYLGKLVRGDLGLSYLYTGRSVISMVKSGFAVTMKLGALAALFATFTGVLLGVLAAVMRGTWVDTAAMLLAVVGVSTPVFVEAIALMFVFGVWLQVLPAQGWGEAKFFVLPVLVLGTRSSAFIARITRSAMLDVIGQDYVRTARAKGLNERRVIFKHAIRNAAIPLVTVLGTTMGSLLAGAYITESIFGVPGLGRVALDAIFQRDYPVVQATTLLVATVFVLVNLFVDLSYAFIDPRIRYL